MLSCSTMMRVKETTGLWIYRFAFAGAVAVALVFLHFVMQARQLWYPCCEEKQLCQMKQIEDSLQPPLTSEGFPARHSAKKGSGTRAKKRVERKM